MKHLMYAIILAFSFTSYPLAAKVLCSTDGHHQMAAVEVIRDLVSNGQLLAEAKNILAQNSLRDQRFTEAIRNRIERELIANLQVDDTVIYFRSGFFLGHELAFELDCLGRWSLDVATPRRGRIEVRPI